jgi:hypothetical protein
MLMRSGLLQASNTNYNNTITSEQQEEAANRLANRTAHYQDSTLLLASMASAAAPTSQPGLQQSKTIWCS